MKRILSIDGGGMKGYIPCAVLVELEKRTGKSVFDMFDMIAGTSIGGILACLFSIGKSASEALEFFTVDGPQIFGKQQLFNMNGVVKPRYGSDIIEKCLKNRLGSATLADCKRQLLVPAFELQSYDPYFFKAPSYDYNWKLWEVARATSAAQSYFPACVLDGMTLWDGGNVANNPAACAIAEGARNWGRSEEIQVFSLSCGANTSPIPPRDLVNAGLIKVGIETMSLLFAANDDLPDYILRHLLDNDYWRISPPLAAVADLKIDGAAPTDLTKLQLAASATIAASTSQLNDFAQQFK